MSRIVVAAALATLFVPAIAQAQARNRRAPADPPPTHWMLAPQGNEARFIVKEQLAGASLPNDAIGTTQAITGNIILDAAGTPDSAASNITVDLRTLTSDRANRDRYIKGRTIVVDSFPNAVFVPTGLTFATGKLGTDGAFTGAMTGLMTIHGTTRPVSWDVSGTIQGGDVTGKATTHIHFGDFNMTQPRVMIVLSVVDDITLEYDFHFVKG